MLRSTSNHPEPFYGNYLDTQTIQICKKWKIIIKTILTHKVEPFFKDFRVFKCYKVRCAVGIDTYSN